MTTTIQFAEQQGSCTCVFTVVVITVHKLEPDKIPTRSGEVGIKPHPYLRSYW